MTARIGERTVGDGQPIFVIAEAGVNHNGDEALALKLVDAAADAHVDAVKFQTFDPAALVSAAAPKADYQQATTGAGTQRAMLEALALSEPAQQRVAEHARERGLMFLSTPFDPASVDVVVRLKVPAIKVSSGDLTALPLLRLIGAKRLPVLLSTGMGTLDEVRAAIAALTSSGAPEVVLLHCLSSYPAPDNEVQLRAMGTLRNKFQKVVGFSDHTVGLPVPFAAAALGAAVIEKHFTLDRGMEGPDHRASLEPGELSQLVSGIRSIEQALGSADKRPMPSERDAIANLRKSIVVARALPRGTKLRGEDLVLKRPGGGIVPADLERVAGRTLKRDLRVDEAVRWEDLE